MTAGIPNHSVAVNDVAINEHIQRTVTVVEARRAPPEFQYTKPLKPPSPPTCT